MRRIGRNIRATVKQGNAIPAVVTDVQNDRVSVRLSGNGALYRSIKLVGGPVAIGQAVTVDFTTSPPTVVAPGAGPGDPGDLRNRKRAKARGADTEPVVSTRPSGDVIWITSPTGTIWGSTTGYPANSYGLQTAIDAISASMDYKGYTIWIPAATIAGDFSFPDFTRVVGMGPGRTILDGLQGSGHGFIFEDLTFLKNGSYNSGGIMIMVEGQGAGDFINCTFAASNTGSTTAVCLGNINYPADWRVTDCVFSGNGIGILTNVLRGGYGGNVAAIRFMAWTGPVTAPSWTVEYDAVDPNWLHFLAQTDFSSYTSFIDGFALQFRTQHYAKEGAILYVELETNKDNTAWTAPYSSTSGSDGLWLEDASVIQQLSESSFNYPLYVPVLPVEDESPIEMVNGNVTWTSIKNTDRLTWKLENVDYGLGSDYSVNPVGGQVAYTAVNPSPYRMMYAYLTRGMGVNALNSRLNQDGYEMWLKVKRAWVQFPDGTKMWIAPLVGYSEVRSTTIACDNTDIDAGPYSIIGADAFSLAAMDSYSGKVIPIESGYHMIVGSEPLANMLPNQYFYDLDP